jgi:hypothetical protein
MKRLSYIIVFLLLVLHGCKKDETPVSGINTIDNTLNGSGPYYAYGFSFSSAELISTLNNPGPDIVLYMNVDNPSQPRLTFQSNTLLPSFSKVGDYPDEASAITAFNNLTTVNATTWTDMADPVNPNQVWIFRSDSETYTKIRVKSTINEVRPSQTYRYGECTFEWVHQPDGSTTFPLK